MALEVPLSASKLKTFDQCPERFRLEYIEGVREMGRPNRWIRAGNAVHEALEDVLADVTTFDEDFLADRFKGAYRANGGPDGYELDDDDHRKVLGCLDTAAGFVAKQSPTIVAIEEEIEFASESVGHDYTGYVDVVTETEVWDWKTGSADDKDLDETLQGTVYMAGFYALQGYKPDAIRFVYLDEGELHTLSPEQQGDEMWNEMTARSRKLLGAVRAERFPPDPGDTKCFHCDAERFCTVAKAGAGSVAWETYP